MGRLIDLTNKKFNRWTVIKRGNAGNNGQVYWICKCDCGIISEVGGVSLRKGTSKSCGCYKVEITKKIHTTRGMTGTPEHNAWISIIQRCTNPNHPQYNDWEDEGLLSVIGRKLLLKTFMMIWEISQRTNILLIE